MAEHLNPDPWPESTRPRKITRDGRVPLGSHAKVPTGADLWAYNNPDAPEAREHFAERRADLERRREYRHRPVPVELDDYDDDLDIDDYDDDLDIDDWPEPEVVPAPRSAREHVALPDPGVDARGMFKCSVLPILPPSVAGPASLASRPRPGVPSGLTPGGSCRG